MNPIIIFIIIIGIDLFMKSFKDKKKIEEARRKRAEQLQKSMTKPKSSMNTINLEDITEKRKDKYENKLIDVREYKADSYFPPKEYEFKSEKDKSMKFKNKAKEVKIETEERKSNSSDLSKDILRGIIFSEILSEPKSIKNMKRSM